MEHMKSSSVTRSRSLCDQCQTPSTFYRSDKCRLRKTVSDGQSLVGPVGSYTACDLQQFGHEQQRINNRKQDTTCKITPACVFTEIKQDQQLSCQLYSQMILLQEKVDRQDEVLGL